MRSLKVTIVKVTIVMLLSAVVSGMLRDEITETGTEGNIAVITCPYGQGYESYTKYFSVVSGMQHEEITETGTEGSIAVITCPYGVEYESYTKYFCKGLYKDCETLIKTNGKDSWTHKDRISMDDNIEQKKLMVTISDLRMEDAGNYGCGIEITGKDPFTLVHLKVNKAPKPPKRTQSKPTQSSPPPATKINENPAPTLSTNKTAVVSGMLRDEITETGTEGNVAVITCPYGQGYESYTKFFCKGIYKVCVTLIKTNGKDSWTHKDRVSLNDNTEQKKLVVTIRDLRMEDAGRYGCGIEITGRDPFTVVHLKVNKGMCCLSFSAYGFYSVFTVEVMKG
ncbi:hypothetical protein MHYP_G00101630 [Metynnis hypsauchen]